MQKITTGVLALLLLCLTGCELIGGIFKAGVGVGIFLVIAVLVIIIAVFGRMFRK
jgi:hypothetical protein